jgi:ataxia telangiectasia mutated family protein
LQLVDHGEGRYVKSSRANKRAKVENPVSTLVQAINDSSSSSQVYRLQLLLFLIDYHWSSFSEEIQREVVSSLVQVLSSEDPMAQSSAFMCLAAAAEATCLADAMAIDVSVWDQVWASSMRKMSSASLCRSAGHCASVLLRRAKRLLSSVRASQEIETFMSDLEVHGPPGLQDAVSTLFVEVLTYAHQDARLYHLKLEDKLLSWLPEVWRNPTESRSRARTRQLGPLYHVPSSLHLLEAVCGLQHKSAIRETVVLPDCVIVNALELYDNTGVIRDFLLHARLPALSESRQHTSSSQPSIIIPATDSFMVGVSGRERRTSALMLKLVEAANDELEEGRDAKSEIYAEEGRKYLDLAVVAMVFSASLLNNGIRPNRRMLQLSCRIVAHVLTMMSSTRWTAEEKSFGLRALAPLVFEVDDVYDAEMWESMVPPSAGTGIKREALTRLLPRFTQVTQAQRSGEWRRHLWQDNDVRPQPSICFPGD